MEKTEIEKRQLTKDEIRSGKVSRQEFCKLLTNRRRIQEFWLAVKRKTSVWDRQLHDGAHHRYRRSCS